MASAVTWDAKDPDEVLDRALDWTVRLPDGDIIETSSWIVPDGIIKNSDHHSDTTTTIWLSGGELYKTYTLVNRVVTRDGRTLDQSAEIRVSVK